MELHSQHRPSGVGKWLAGLGLVLLFFLSLVSPRFWGPQDSNKTDHPSVLARLGSRSTHASSRLTQSAEAQEPAPPTLEPSPLATQLPPVDTPRDLPPGEVLAALPVTPAQPEITQTVADEIPGPSIFGVGATIGPSLMSPVESAEDVAAAEDTVLPRLEPPSQQLELTPPRQQRSLQEPELPIQSQEPRSQGLESPANNDVLLLPNNATDDGDTGHEDQDPIEDRPGRTEAPITPVTINNAVEPTTPLSRDEIVRGRWPWLRPRRIESYLDQLQDHAQCAMWADDVRWLIEETFGPEDLVATLPELREQVAYAESMLSEMGHSEHASLLRRAAYALKRNLAAWEAAANSMKVSAALDTKSWSLEVRHKLTQRIESVEARLASSGNREAWRHFLRLDELSQFATRSLNSNEIVADELSLKLLRDVSRRFDGVNMTADQRNFLATNELAELRLQLLRMTAPPVDRNALLTAIERYEYTGLPNDAEEVALHLEDLRISGRAEDVQLAEAIEGFYRNNNVRFAVTGDFLTKILPPQADRTEFTNDTILGVPVSGQSNTKTRLAFRMAPGDSAGLDFLIMGDVDSLTRGDSGLVRTYNHTNATYVVHKRLSLDGRGIRTTPGQVQVFADSRLQCLETDLDGVPLFGSIVRAVAEQKVADSKDEARREIEQRIAAKVLKRVDEEADAGFAKLNAKLFRHLATAQDLGLRPAAWFQHPDETRLAVHLRMASNGQLAAHTPRPRALSNSLASIQLHQSMLNNMLESLDFNGRTLTVEEAFVHVMDKLTLTMDFTAMEDGDSLITFAQHNPITVSMEGGLLRLCLRIQRVQAEEGDWGPLGVYVSYRPVPAGAGYVLLREGPISLDSRSLRFRDTVVLRGVFAKVFKKDKPVALFGEALDTDPRFEGLGVAQLEIEDGWVGISIGPAKDRLVQNPLVQNPSAENQTPSNRR
ncbi:MAG: hypothetical protein MPJ50_08960 [Pirellulales bacterium]|nr:hypothetical protein [Pirellulales bacterium]